MVLGLKILIIVSLLLGIIVCIRGMKKKKILYKGGFYFFLLSFFVNIYSLVIPRFIEKLIDKGVDNPGLWIRNSNIPPLLFTAISLVIFIVFLLKGLSENSNN
jgi:hypothetical protein